MERFFDVEKNLWEISIIIIEVSGVRNLFLFSEFDKLRVMFKVMITILVFILRFKVKEIFEKEDGGKGFL